MPAAVSAQEPPTQPHPIDPLPPRSCSFDCWWPVGSVAQFDAMEAEVEVGDGVMIARYRFLLSNPFPPYEDFVRADAEGRIVFPVLPGSSVTDLLLSGGPETLEGRVLDADEAARIYEEIVRRLIDPALLRSLGDDLYEVRAFPVPAGEEREVSFTVTTPLLAEGEQVLVEIPLVANVAASRERRRLRRHRRALGGALRARAGLRSRRRAHRAGPPRAELGVRRGLDPGRQLPALPWRR